MAFVGPRKYLAVMALGAPSARPKPKARALPTSVAWAVTAGARSEARRTVGPRRRFMAPIVRPDLARAALFARLEVAQVRERA
jgi:hypothetical protein